MRNKDAQSYYDSMAEKIQDPHETRNKAKDFTPYDIQLMKKFRDKNATLLDLGSGTGLLVNGLVEDFKKIIAVEKYPQFSKFIVKHSSIEIVNMDILDFDSKEKFELISLFGVMNYFNYNEAKKIYKKVFELLTDNGIMIIKNQMGLEEDVVVNGWSDELQTNYFSEYRYVESEIKLLHDFGFHHVEKIDIYPPEYNRWDNTHFYALICKK